VFLPISRAEERRHDERDAWGGLAVLAGSLILARPVAAQIKETEDRLRVAAEKLEGIVKDALSRSREIGRNNPMRALEILREAKIYLLLTRKL